MDRFWESAACFLGLKKRSKKRIDKEKRGIALNLNSARTNELTVHKTPDEKEGKLKDKGKLFVGGLNYATTSKELSVYFSKFGDVINSVVIKCPISGKSRGFGFVSFLDPADAEKALQTKHHVLHGRTIECRPFDSKVDSKEIKPKRSEKARVFLGGLPADVTKKELEQFFSRYGKVMGVYVPIDGKTKQGKGFAFISFENEDDAEKCISERFVYLKGRRIFMNKADPRDAGSRAENGISGSHGSTLTDQDSFTEYTEDTASLPDEDSQSSSSEFPISNVISICESHMCRPLGSCEPAKEMGWIAQGSSAKFGLLPSGRMPLRQLNVRFLSDFLDSLMSNDKWEFDLVGLNCEIVTLPRQELEELTVLQGFPLCVVRNIL